MGFKIFYYLKLLNLYLVFSNLKNYIFITTYYKNVILEAKQLYFWNLFD